ncbi:TIGR04211 family SH3 domain-containing protein [Marinagarivorans cellulosilyticus]|uniref:SH3 domain protein n=1 Tax=Marinagarivorans cellulosilyticus TaxID=2721545 RepID=A0AAN1WJW1_9GAMM|nr:TIGR04211 family SH3 domain-containing protein [Marinagarivorans cellulosilyticus]BCD98915.1 SH3 domain protein [Marinagarivorans cellulosilyticus]
MNSKIFVLSAILLSTLFSSNSWAQTRYITDSLMVPLRSGPGNEFRIINSRIRSGTKLQVLDEPTGDWAQVKLPAGTEGWIRKQYLQNSPVAKTLLENAQAKQAQAEATLAAKTQELTELQNKHAELKKISSHVQSEHASLSTEYQNLKILSEDAVNLSSRYRDLLAEHEVLLTQHDALKAENDNLRSDQTISHGLYAIALLLAGMLLAIVLPMFRPRKRYSDQIL